eukprot:482654-Pelagomonas_calceolata.AAC.2
MACALGLCHSGFPCRSLAAQVDSLCTAWEWGPEDAILHPLPLHHIHGIVNALYCPLYAGARVEFLPKFSPMAVWDRIMVCASIDLSRFGGLQILAVPPSGASMHAQITRLYCAINWHHVEWEIPLLCYSA